MIVFFKFVIRTVETLSMVWNGSPRARTSSGDAVRALWTLLCSVANLPDSSRGFRVEVFFDLVYYRGWDRS